MMNKIIDSTNITPITISYNLFMCGAEQWAPKGVCYQPKDFVDPISDSNLNLTAIKHLLDSKTTFGFTNMKLNAIRVYQVDPTKDHKKVMDAFAAAGIYVLIGAVNNVVTVFSGAKKYNDRLEAIADEFCKYKNVLGFSLGNESIGSNGNLPGYDIPTKIRAGAKHLKAYMAAKKYRVIPVTAALRDDPEYTIPAAKAYMCGDASERLDFLGYNCERWAGGTLAAKIGAYYNLAKHFEGFNPVPITFTEMGSNPVDFNPRTWEQIPYLFGVKKLVPQSGTGSLNMADIISGGFAFRYYNGPSGWGMLTEEGVEIPGHGAKSIIMEYTKIVSFSSKGNAIGKVRCDPSNPYVSGGSSGLPAGTCITFTFEVKNSTAIVLNYSMKSSGDNDWIKLISGVFGDKSTTGTLPKGTKRVSVAYEKGGQWYNACSINDATVIKENDTIVGGWVSPNGEGVCKLI